jgi:hypothetical protein
VTNTTGRWDETLRANDISARDKHVAREQEGRWKGMCPGGGRRGAAVGGGLMQFGSDPPYHEEGRG